MSRFISHILLSLLAILTFTPQEVSAKVLLVAVGIGDYPKPINPLNLPTKDAIAIKTLIDKNGDAGTAILLDKEATKLSLIHI